MKAPVGLLSNGTVLRSKMEGPRPEKFPEKKNTAYAVQAKDFVGWNSGKMIGCVAGRYVLSEQSSAESGGYHGENHHFSAGFGIKGSMEV